MYCCANGEDATLDKLTDYKSIGFYIDVGSHSPHHESVTKCFYDRGWHGINIEPQTNRYQELMAARPRDINLAVACGAVDGELELYLGDGLTTAKKDFAHSDWVITKVAMRQLSAICDEYVRDHPIDFLKIDVEGFERDVIKGMNWTKYRPRILCIEATVPMSTTPNYEEWEPLVLAAGYEFIEADLVNRYYRDTTDYIEMAKLYTEIKNYPTTHPLTIKQRMFDMVDDALKETNS